MNTKTSIYEDKDIEPANYQEPKELKVEFEMVSNYEEMTPYKSTIEGIEDTRQVFSATSPLEQLSVTKDITDYLWYSAMVPKDEISYYGGSISFTTGAAGGGVVYAYINGEYIGTSTGGDGSPPVVGKATLIMVRGLPASCYTSDVCQLDLLSMNMGVQNYGPFLEKASTGMYNRVYI